MLIFDIETGPLDEGAVLANAKPFDPPPHPGEFDPSSVKTGNLKDKAKIEAKLNEASFAHAAAVMSYETDRLAAEMRWKEEALERAPLSPVTGQVLAIGYLSKVNGNVAIDHGSDPETGEVQEQILLARFWGKYVKMRKDQRPMVGANIFGFDLPFLVRRSWILGVDVPSTLRTDNRYWDRLFIDIRDVWLLGQRWGDCESSLDVMARALGCGQKPEDCDGASFHKLWNGTADERATAVAYLINDLEMTSQVAERLGIV